MDAVKLEEDAKAARRLADISKHTPLSMDELDKYGQDACKQSGHAQVKLFELGLDLQNAYAKELTPLWNTIKTLRMEALYWRHKFLELEKLSST